MLFQRAVLDGIAAGTISLAFRRGKPRVSVGSTLRTRIGVLVIDEVTQVEEGDVTDEDAARAGAASRAEVIDRFPCRPDRSLWRVRLHLAGPDPRIALRDSADLTLEDVARLEQRLQRLDHASTHGPWTAATLATIEQRPATRAADLAASLGRDMLPFKIDVRKLKELGLTESLDVGYRLSPRGTAFLRSRADAEPS
ncbi:MAG: hypothetical protein H0V10_07115 [Geodermatophilaceae bacterium]|nr:hypothetical protein [Geodermatophilaceae bacterium]